MFSKAMSEPVSDPSPLSPSFSFLLCCFCISVLPSSPSNENRKALDKGLRQWCLVHKHSPRLTEVSSIYFQRLLSCPFSLTYTNETRPTLSQRQCLPKDQMRKGLDFKSPHLLTWPLTINFVSLVWWLALNRGMISSHLGLGLSKNGPFIM